MSTDPLIEQTRRYYDDALRTHGATPRGVDWNSVESQELRFDKLALTLADRTDASVLDYGCGYAPGPLPARPRTSWRLSEFRPQRRRDCRSARLHGYCGFRVQRSDRQRRGGQASAGLYYADALALFEHCRIRFSRHVALLHDYPLYEFRFQ